MADRGPQRRARAAPRRAASNAGVSGPAELLDLVHLREFADKRPHELSGGMRQRVALARALGQRTDVLLMDEPFGALDAMTRDTLHDEVERIWRETGVSILFVTHNVREAVRLGDRVVLLSSRPGRVIAEFPVPVERPRRIDSTRWRSSRPRSPTSSARRSAAMATTDPPVTDDSRIEAQPRASIARARPATPRRRAARIWAHLWPKALAVGIFLAFWQVVVWTGWRPQYLLPGPVTVFQALFSLRHPDERRPHHVGPRRAGLRPRHRDRVAVRCARRPQPGAARGGRFPHHRAADDAVDRLVSARHLAVRPPTGRSSSWS